MMLKASAVVHVPLGQLNVILGRAIILENQHVFSRALRSESPLMKIWMLRISESISVVGRIGHRSAMWIANWPLHAPRLCVPTQNTHISPRNCCCATSIFANVSCVLRNATPDSER